MRTLLSNVWRLQRRIRRYQQVASLSDSLKLCSIHHGQGDIQIFLKPARRNVVLRRGTTDLQCLEKVFIDHEYKLPFAVSPQVIVDAGANIGMATIYFATEYPGARIVAIEPELSNFEILKRNCGDYPNVSLIHAALWPSRDALEVFDSSAEKWAFTVRGRAASNCNKEIIPAITIADVLSYINEERIDLLKLDIEGSELELFTGGPERWLGYVSMIAVELHDRFRPGCSQAFYSALYGRNFIQEMRGENIFIRLE